jgi:hypothetical protein
MDTVWDSDTEDMDTEDMEDTVWDSVDVVLDAVWDTEDMDMEDTVWDSVDVVLDAVWDTEDTDMEDLDLTILIMPALSLLSTNATLLGEPTAVSSLDTETAISLTSKELTSLGITTIATTFLPLNDVKFLVKYDFELRKYYIVYTIFIEFNYTILDSLRLICTDLQCIP